MELSVNTKLIELRSLMKIHGMDSFLLTKFDPHQSEYGNPFWNCVKFISGFTGSAGTVVVTLGKAVLWTDGRYELQSQEQLTGTEFDIINTSTPGSVDYVTYLAEHTPNDGCIGVDERTVSSVQAKALLKKITDKNIHIKSGEEVISILWKNRPAPSNAKVFNHELCYCGTSRLEKINLVRKEMKAKGGTCYIISSLDDIAWLFNLRAKTDATLTFESYTIITETNSVLFVDETNICDVKEELENVGIEIKPYGSFMAFLTNHLTNGREKVVICPDKTCYALYNVLDNPSIIDISCDITTTLKASKNPTEIENTKNISIRDGVSLVKFIKWIKEAAKSGEVSEYEAGKKLDSMRAQEPTFICPSFSTILGFEPNGAIIHYKADAEKCSKIKPEGLLLVDSGGNYLGGTTDITRTMVLGNITDEMKRNFTLVLKCHIALAKAIFVSGTSGHYIDILARKPLWDNMMDFKHGTGHGIGFALSVHEGPQRIAAQPNNIALIEGMLISNEPGYYVQGQYGIRHENTILVKEYGESEYGKFLCFDTISFCPFDLEAIEVSLLNDSEREWLNNYHDETYNKLSPYLNEEEKQWLKTQVSHI